MTQILARYHITDYARFRAAFDADAEDRGHAGLTLLQLWREGGAQVWALYATANAGKSRDYLTGAAKVFEAQAGVSAADIHLLETA